MDELYRVRYKLGPRPVEEAIVRASSQAKAHDVGEALAKRKMAAIAGPGWLLKLAGVTPFVEADESILPVTFHGAKIDAEHYEPLPGPSKPAGKVPGR